MTAAEFQAAGLYDPAAPDAPARLEFLEWLAAQGATLADMREAELRWGALGPRGRPCAPRRRAADPRRGGGALGHVARADRALRSRGRVPARRPRGAGLRPRDGGHVRELRGRRAVLRSGSAAALHPRARLVGRTHRRSRRLALPRQRRGSHRRARRERARARSNVRRRTIPSGRRSPAARDRVALGALVPRAFFRYAPGPVARDELLRGDGRATARAGAPAALNGPALEVEELRHRYGERIALDGVSLRVERGELFGLLGPNGGGKSTLFRILSTLLTAGGGAARVLGYDVAREPDRVRRRLGVVFQHASVDRTLTVQENLVHHGHLYGLSGASLRAAVEAVTGRLGLAERRRDRVGTLSGGLQRRTELAKALLVGAVLLLR